MAPQQLDPLAFIWVGLGLLGIIVFYAPFFLLMEYFGWNPALGILAGILFACMLGGLRDMLIGRK